jgi:hypothetical protein
MKIAGVFGVKRKQFEGSKKKIMILIEILIRNPSIIAICLVLVGMLQPK